MRKNRNQQNESQVRARLRARTGGREAKLASFEWASHNDPLDPCTMEVIAALDAAIHTRKGVYS